MPFICFVYLSDIRRLVVQIHGTVELFGLLLIGLELGMRLKWLGKRAYLHHTRTMIKVGYKLFEYCQTPHSLPGTSRNWHT